jgi:hypothetical protein
MKLKHQISFNGIPQVEKSFDQMNLTYKFFGGLVGRLVILEIYEDDERWLHVKRLISQFGLSDTVGTHFEKEDYEMANWFVVSAREYGYPQPESNFGYLSESYQLVDFCKFCGVGKTQNKYFQLKTSMSEVKSDIFGINWVHDALFMKDELKTVYESSGVKGLEYIQVIQNKDKIPFDNFFQIQPSNKLKGGVDAYNLNTELCQNHQSSQTSIKYNYPMIGGITIDEKLFPTDVDLVQMKDWFGSGGDAHQPILCSRKFYELVKENKWKKVGFTPVFHEHVKFERK